MSNLRYINFLPYTDHRTGRKQDRTEMFDNFLDTGTGSGRLLFDDARYVGRAHAVDLADRAANLVCDSIGLFLFVQIELHLEIKIHARHVADDTMMMTIL